MTQHLAAPQRPPPSTAPSETAQPTGEKNDLMRDNKAVGAKLLHPSAAAPGTASSCVPDKPSNGLLRDKNN